MTDSLFWHAVVFLLVPQGLTWVFLPILAFVFAGGVVRLVRHQRELRPKLDAVGAGYRDPGAEMFRRVPPRDFIRASLDDESFERVATAIPSSLITIGILGTFIGLGVAIRLAAGNLSDPDSAMKSLEDLLATVAFKFQTSAWGIILSLAFQNVFLRRHDAAQESEKEALERELLREFEPAGVVISRLADQLDRSADSLRNSTEQLHRLMTSSTTELHVAMTSLGGLGTKLEGAVEKMGGDVSSTLQTAIQNQSAELRTLNVGLKEQMAGVANAVTGLNAAVGKLGTDLAGTLSSEQQRSREDAAELHREQKAATTALDEGLRMRLGDVATAVGQLGGVLGDLDKNLGNTLADQQRMSREQAANLHESLERQLGSVSSTISGLSSDLKAQLQENRRDQNAVVEVLDRGLRERLSEVGTAIGQVRGALDTLEQSLSKHLGETAEYVRGLDASMEQVRNILGKFQRNLGDFVEITKAKEAQLDADVDFDAVLETGGAAR